MQFSSDYEIVAATNFEEIEAIRPIWEQMQRDDPHPVPNADIDRYLSVVKTSGDDVQSHIMIMKCDGHPVAITIGRIEKHQLDFKLGYKALFRPALRCLSIVYGGIIGQPSAELCEALFNELMNVLRSGQADLVFFNHLGIDSPMYKLCKTMPGVFGRGHFASAEPHWQTYIPDSVEEFYSQIPSSRKRRWRRDIRQLEKISSSEIKIVCYRQLSDVNYLIDVACQIKESTYKSGLAVGFTNSNVNRVLLEKAAEDGRLRAYILYVGDEPCAFQFDVLYGKTQFTEFGSFDPRWSRGSPGTVLLIKVLEQLCIESEVNIMDYGFGHALYKSKFGTNHWLEENVRIYAPRLRPILINIAMSANLACCVFLNSAAKWLNMDSWIKRKWRRMVRTNGRNGSTQEKGKHRITILMSSAIAVLGLIFLYVGVPWIYGQLARRLIERRAKEQKALVLTFDDGPGNNLTPVILDILAEGKAKATFFLLGRNIVGREAIVRQIAEQGHDICSHGYDHLNSLKVSPFRVLSDIKRGWEAIDAALGTMRNKYPFRPPNGKLNIISLLYLLIRQVPIVYWSVDSGDTWHRQPDSLRVALLAEKTGGAVSLTHDFDRKNDNTNRFVIKSVTAALAMAADKGMRVLTVSELLDIDR